MKAITANRLTDGKVVYARQDGGWSEDLAEAARYEGEAAEAALEAALRDILAVVGPYLIEIEGDAPAGRTWRREAIRGAGPTTGTSYLTAAKQGA